MDVKNQKLTSLLNYRFVKKPVTKLQSDSCPSTESTSSMDSAVNVQTLDRVSSVDSQSSDSTVLYSQARVNSVCSSQELDSQETVVYGDSYSRENSIDTPVKNGTSITAVPETPKSELTSSGSPVFRKKGKGVKMLITDESDESQEPATPSPWLSKEQGIVSNGVSNTSLANRRKSKQIIRQEFDGDDETEMTMQQNEKMNNLMAMFPSQSTEMINSALRNAEWDQEKAIDILISGVNIIRPGRSKKRTKRIVSSDSDGSPPGRPAKKSRISNTDDANDEDYGERTKQDISKEKKMKYLSEVFPNLHRRVLYKALDNNRWHVDDAMIELTNREEGDSSNKKQDALDDEEESYESRDEGADSDDSFEGEVEENSSIKKIILSFFEEATLDELAATPGCSKKRAEIIVSLRPFGDWTNMINTFTTTKGLSYDIISGCKEIIRVREVVVRLMQKCEKIAKEMESVVSYLTRRTDIEESEDSDALQITKQPVYLCDKFQLKPFQMVGLNWLRIMHTQQLNGILADEMGLGKTIQTISFIAHLLEEGEEGPHVVIVPSSTIENWMREFHNWCPTIKVLVYYGSQEDRRVTRQSILYENYDDFNVILTTYNMATGSVEDRSLFKKLDFHYAIFDEGHMLKNMSSLRYQNLMKITSERRLLLTGTPLQNNLLELMSLLCFVMPEMFIGKTDHLKRMFSMITRGSEDKSRSKYEMERIMHAKRIMKPFVLRRLKADVQKQLPQKDDNTQYCQMIPEQKEIYNNLITKFSKAIKEDRVKESNGGSSMLMQLRKVANHPLLVRSFYNDDKLMKMAKQIAKEPSHRDRGALPKFIFEDMAVMNDFDIMKLCDTYKKYVGSFKPDPSVVEDSGKFRAMDKLLQKFHTQGDRVLIFSQFTMMMDIMEEFLQRKEYSYLRLDGSTPVPERQDMLDKYTNDESIFIFMLSTRAGGLGINLTAANVVIIHDIDFNPYNDKQAEDRCHRVGQTREVKVIRLISKDTVEEGMLRCAKDKLKLEKDVIVDEEIDKESARDVASLLKEALAERKV